LRLLQFKIEKWRWRERATLERHSCCMVQDSVQLLRSPSCTATECHIMNIDEEQQEKLYLVSRAMFG
jgi:hypothetical protein